jgi:hypothetical protein
MHNVCILLTFSPTRMIETLFYQSLSSRLALYDFQYFVKE